MLSVKNLISVRLPILLPPLAGALAFPIIVPIATNKFGLGAVVTTAVIVGFLWFLIMLLTARDASSDHYQNPCWELFRSNWA